MFPDECHRKKYAEHMHREHISQVHYLQILAFVQIWTLAKQYIIYLFIFTDVRM